MDKPPKGSMEFSPLFSLFCVHAELRVFTEGEDMALVFTFLAYSFVPCPVSESSPLIVLVMV